MPTSPSSSLSVHQDVITVPAPTCMKLIALSFFSLTLLFLGKHISDHSFTKQYSPAPATIVNSTVNPVIPSPAEIIDTVLHDVTNPPPPPPPPDGFVERTGIVDENGIMTANFRVGEFDQSLIDQNQEWADRETHEKNTSRPIHVDKYRICEEDDINMVPCFDYSSMEEIRKRNNNYDRHCPQEELQGDDINDYSLISNCIVPRPNGYKFRIPWPNSRNQIWAKNIPMGSEEEEEFINGERKWISKEEDKFIFPKQDEMQNYLDHISKMAPEIAFGIKTHLVLDLGDGIGSLGAFLDYLYNVTTITINAAPTMVMVDKLKKMKNQQLLIQLVLERGLPAMVAPFSSHRFPFSSQAFDLIHSCLLDDWTVNDGIRLLEVDRLLRAGGYFVWSPPLTFINHNSSQSHNLQQWKEMEDLTERICWKIVKKEDNIVIWQKPLNNSCYLNRDSNAKPQLCNANDDPDNVWNVEQKACISRLPNDNNYVTANISTWPERLHDLPKRLSTVEMDAFVSRQDLLLADKKHWENIVYGYVNVFGVKNLIARNVMDMRSVYGGFAAALHDSGIDCWVMNVVPVSGLNTLPLIYDRGLIGVRHDWCEPFDTYPRTYDILNAASLFSVEQKRCDISKILLEMDRILRPGGRVFIMDTVTVIAEIKEIANSMGWVMMQFNTIEGPHSSFKLLLGEKRL
ncbi:probable methyltransferase PMT10 [Impatiens glandulifera]|uniref:probable methyltransferase PMT10 n=1 Tax=Impatiens glandulifera TaxID=253017 RepID=UPI001FB13228|nr:probable methyltransferase PMT10 [Impatiens glandulifera]